MGIDGGGGEMCVCVGIGRGLIDWLGTRAGISTRRSNRSVDEFDGSNESNEPIEEH